jgi:hypothetical protein
MRTIAYSYNTVLEDNDMLALIEWESILNKINLLKALPEDQQINRGLVGMKLQLQDALTSETKRLYNQLQVLYAMRAYISKFELDFYYINKHIEYLKIINKKLDELLNIITCNIEQFTICNPYLIALEINLILAEYYLGKKDTKNTNEALNNFLYEFPEYKNKFTWELLKAKKEKREGIAVVGLPIYKDTMKDLELLEKRYKELHANLASFQKKALDITTAVSATTASGEGTSSTGNSHNLSLGTVYQMITARFTADTTVGANAGSTAPTPVLVSAIHQEATNNHKKSSVKSKPPVNSTASGPKQVISTRSATGI